MTNRKCCGSCRFFDGGTVSGHGWCRNPDYEGRDDTVLLRAEELACRSGWQKDFWQASPLPNERAAETAAIAALPGDQGAVLPIGQGIAAHIPTEVIVTTPKPGVAVGKPAIHAYPAGRRRAGQPGATGSPAAVAQTRSAQEAGASVAPTLQGHPELGANGEVLRKPSRSMVAEAHRKALERREAERELAVMRRQEQHDAALATIFPAAKPPAGRDEGRARGAEAAAAMSYAPSNPAAADQAERRPMPPSVPLPDADDRPIAPDRPAALAASASKPPRVEEATNLPSSQPPLGTLPVAQAMTARRDAEPLPAAAVEMPGTAGVARYWDEPGANNRFMRMRPEAAEISQGRHDPHQAATVQTPVPNVGRPRAETPIASEPMGGRTIRPRQPLATTAPMDPDDIPKPTSAPARIPRPAPSVEEPRTAEPKLPTMPPRQIDELLLKQLQRDWREQALAMHSGQRCGTCRFFQATEAAERGSCGCSFADSYRQAQGRQDLGCLSPLGTWWAADDAGWLQKTDFGPRRQTPLIDKLIEEWGVPDVAAPVAEERRRSAR